jgi:sulfoxide reductase heme-binding subunit YedZ
VIAVAAHGPSVLWYATRGAGAVAMVLLTLSVALGIAETRMWSPARTPRFTIAALHRSVSLLAVAFLVLHVVTVVVDPFPPIGVLNAVIPFVTSYRALWLGLGTIAFDLMLAIVVTSLARRRLGYRTWKGVHWLAYASWPVALLHGFGAGSDEKATWMLALSAGCVALVLAAVAFRLAAREVPAGVRVGGATGMTAALIALIAWVAQGPLAHGWASRAGTPQSVLSAFAPHVPATRVATHTAPAPADPLTRPFTATVAGTVHEGTSSDGTGVVDLSMRLEGGPSGRLRIRLGGEPLPNGGLHMDRSAVTLGPPSDPGRYQGRINFLAGSRLRALVGGAQGAVRLTLDLSLGQSSVSGRLTARPAGGGAT